MKYLIGTLVILILLAAAAGFTGYRMSCEPVLHNAVVKGDAMEWLRADFHLTDAQYSRVRELHESYAGSCAEHCRLIQEANKARSALMAANPSDTTAINDAERNIQDLRVRCETAITRHVRQVATVMSPADAQRYLALVLPKIANFDHQAVPDLHLNHSS